MNLGATSSWGCSSSAGISERAVALLRDLDPEDLAAMSDVQAAALAQRLAPFLQPQGEDPKGIVAPLVDI